MVTKTKVSVYEVSYDIIRRERKFVGADNRDEALKIVKKEHKKYSKKFGYKAQNYKVSVFKE